MYTQWNISKSNLFATYFCVRNIYIFVCVRLMQINLTILFLHWALFIQGSVLAGFIVLQMDLILTSSYGWKRLINVLENKIQLYMCYLILKRQQAIYQYLYTWCKERHLCCLRYYECEQNNYQNLCVILVLLLKTGNMCWIISSLCCLSLLQAKY